MAVPTKNNTDMQERIVSKEVAIAMKDAGFNTVCLYGYMQEDSKTPIVKESIAKCAYEAMTQQMAIDWIFDKFGKFVNVVPTAKDKYTYVILSVTDKGMSPLKGRKARDFNSLEEAANKGILSALAKSTKE